MIIMLQLIKGRLWWLTIFMSKLHYVSFILLLAGGLNWLLIGAFGWNVVEMLLGLSIAGWVYILVGLSAIVEIVLHKKLCKMCSGQMSGQM